MTSFTDEFHVAQECAESLALAKVSAHWQHVVKAIDRASSNPTTTCDSFELMVKLNTERFNQAVDEEKATYLALLDALLVTLRKKLDDAISALKGKGCSTDTPAGVNANRLLKIRSQHFTQLYMNTTQRVIHHATTYAPSEFAAGVHRLMVYPIRLVEIIVMLKTEKLVDGKGLVPIPPFVMQGRDAFIIGPTTPCGPELVMRKVCRHCYTAFHGEISVITRRPYLVDLIRRECPRAPDHLCVDSLIWARVSHVGSSSAYVEALQDARGRHETQVRAERNSRYYRKRKNEQ